MTTEMTLQTARDVAERRRALTERMKNKLIERLSLQLSAEEIADDSPLFGTGLSLDSVDALEIAIMIELEFGVAVSDDELASFRSVNTLVDLVQERMGSAEELA
ncbi:acyl carrier protein [Paraburkholderia terricola]|uniref:Acyl carrier protein n=1 Tax=Paraburkholderia terricola TaxID=169427 RepID=A0ABU1M1W5_9BURK|nr:phosphopantetheine-binding protein [Paraburkholderia terricola]MDR6412841.1 acyl carrier protein [Paraburkholderia terricola]MDR6450049.1 acyl carrier protein [Paraburkholderia terricola]MDR6484887.1 acyl carrier protein [Paraburkholderia terricola]